VRLQAVKTGRIISYLPKLEDSQLRQTLTMRMKRLELEKQRFYLNYAVSGSIA